MKYRIYADANGMSGLWGPCPIGFECIALQKDGNWIASFVDRDRVRYSEERLAESLRLNPNLSMRELTQEEVIEEVLHLFAMEGNLA